MAYLDSKSEFNGRNSEPHIEVESQHLTLDPIPQFQRTFFKGGLLTNRLPDSQVKFEPNAVSIFSKYIPKYFYIFTYAYPGLDLVNIVAISLLFTKLSLFTKLCLNKE